MIVDLAVSAGVALIAGTFAVALRRRRFDTIDTAWGLGFAAIAVVTCALAAGDLVPRILSTLLTVVWGVRLSVHIHLRNRGGGEDKRYAQMRQRPGRMFVRVYLTQAALIWLVSLPVQVAQYGRGAPVFLYCVAVMVWAFRFAFETIGDYQLQRFRADPATAARRWTPACGATPATRTTWVTRVSGGVCTCWRARVGSARPPLCRRS